MQCMLAMRCQKAQAQTNTERDHRKGQGAEQQEMLTGERLRWMLTEKREWPQ